MRRPPPSSRFRVYKVQTKRGNDGCLNYDPVSEYGTSLKDLEGCEGWVVVGGGNGVLCFSLDSRVRGNDGMFAGMTEPEVALTKRNWSRPGSLNKE